MIAPTVDLAPGTGDVAERGCNPALGGDTVRAQRVNLGHHCDVLEAPLPRGERRPGPSDTEANDDHVVGVERAGHLTSPSKLRAAGAGPPVWRNEP